MKKHLTIAAAILFTLAAAVSATSGEERHAGGISAATQTGSTQSTQILKLWETHASSSGSIPLARPL